MDEIRQDNREHITMALTYRHYKEASRRRRGGASSPLRLSSLLSGGDTPLLQAKLAMAHSRL